MTASLTSELSSSSPQSASVTFSGRGREFLNLLVKGSLFQIPTFGFYRFWLVTKLRRHLWANTQVGGEAFEYTGTAKELLIGFLIALAILTPIYLGYFALGIILEEAKALASLPLVLVMYVLMHFASYRARRYRATRTVFRGIRFWMKGSGWTYALRAILWDIATVLTLGLALPWASASLERYRMRHTYFGTVQGDFTGTGWTLFKRGWWVWALGVALIVGPFVALGALYGFTEEVGEGDAVMQLFPFLLILIVFALLPLAMAIFNRWRLEGIRFGEVAVSSNLRKGAFYGIFLKLIFSSIGFVIAFAAVVGIVAVLTGTFFSETLEAIRAGAQSGEMTSAPITLIVAVALVYLVVFLGLGVIQQYFIGRGLWAVVVSSLSISNLHALNAAVAAGQPSGVVGEGLADALDFQVGL